MAESRGKKRNNHHEEHEEHVNHEAWVLPYADMLTLLMALFLVMWAVGNSEEDLAAAAESFRAASGGGSDSVFDLGFGADGNGALGDGDGILPGAGTVPTTTEPGESPITPDTIVIMPPIEGREDDETPLELPEGLTDPIESIEGIPGDPLDEVERVLRNRARGSGFDESITLRREDRGLVVTIVTDQVLFNAGQARVQEGGFEILDVVAEALLDVPNLVAIEGHSDNRPISTARFQNNWELSSIRATNVLIYFIEEWDFPVERLTATGWGDTRPIADGDDAASLARNRRVEIVVKENL